MYGAPGWACKRTLRSPFASPLSDQRAPARPGRFRPAPDGRSTLSESKHSVQGPFHNIMRLGVRVRSLSALLAEADVCRAKAHVRQGPRADIQRISATGETSLG